MAGGLIIIYLLGGFAPQLTVELGLSRVTLGAISTLFYVFAAVISGFSSGFVAKIGAASSLPLLFACAAAACVALALANGPVVLVVAVLLGGVAAALSNPSTNEFLAGMPPPFGVLVGVKQSGVQVAALVAGTVVVPLAVLTGWRPAVAATGGLCLVFAVMSWLTLRGASHASAAASSAHRSWAHWALLLYAFLMGGGLATVTTYLALFGFERLDIPSEVAGMAVGIVGAGGVVARVFWGVVGERFGRSRLRLFLCGQAAFACLSSVLLVFAHGWGAGLIWVAALVLGLSATAWTGLVYLFVILRGVEVGRISGQIQMAFFVGLMSTPLVFGAVLDSTGSYEWAWTGTAALFFVAAFFALRVPPSMVHGRGEAESVA